MLMNVPSILPRENNLCHRFRESQSLAEETEDDVQSEDQDSERRPSVDLENLLDSIEKSERAIPAEIPGKSYQLVLLIYIIEQNIFVHNISNKIKNPFIKSRFAS